MKTLIRIILALLLVITSGPLRADEITRDRLVGTWILKALIAGAKVHGETTYKKDGTFVASATATSDDEEIKFSGSGKWTLKENKLSYEITQSSDEDFVEVGEKMTDTILELTDSKLRCKDEEGSIVEMTRAPDQK